MHDVFLSEMSEMSAFKNYTPGDPTCRLYIKNLAKHVEEKVDLCFHSLKLVGHQEQISTSVLRLNIAPGRRQISCS